MSEQDRVIAKSSEETMWHYPDIVLMEREDGSRYTRWFGSTYEVDDAIAHQIFGHSAEDEVKERIKKMKVRLRGMENFLVAMQAKGENEVLFNENKGAANALVKVLAQDLARRMQ